ncbi:hypothetical protein TNIN_188051 [Trichonephila inaurata madagascariensis]|uniref:Uncharacterized protein n=1 Tax=Trichonephila inaurata madagascariensis TaxID=2747483 RepID=A0A8X6X1Z9_9ARAC|nr:hypothetical protein TNIN_188051 [Trichonephila inaurata madagascariensis]
MNLLFNSVLFLNMDISKMKYSKFCEECIVSILDVTKLTYRSTSQEFTTGILAVIKCNISYLFLNKKWIRKKLLWIK